MTDLNNGAKAYGEALFMLTEEMSETEAVLADARAVKDVIEANPSYLQLLDSPALSRDERIALIDKAFGTLNKSLVNLMKILTEKRLAHLLIKAIGEYEKSYEHSRGIERVEAISAVPLSEAQINRLKAKLEAITGKQIIVRNTHAPELLGGMKLRYLGIQLDDTVKSRLESFEKRLGELVI